MPLSDHEQRVLEQMERALAAEDPKFASSFHGAASRRHTRRRLLLAFTGVLLGLALLLSAVVVNAIATRLPLQIVVGLVGFILMLASAYFAVLCLRPGAVASPKPAGDQASRPHQAARAGDAGFMSRFEQRWQRRRGREV